MPLSVRAGPSSKCRASPKSAILGVPSAREQDVGRLQVAVHDPAPVRHLHGLGQRGQQRRRLAGRLRCAREGLRQAAPFQELHREKRAALMVAHIVDLHDVGVAQAPPPPPLRAGTSPARAAPAYAPACSILRATRRFRRKCRAL